MFSLILSLISNIFKPIANWWKNLTNHDRIMVILVLLVVGTVVYLKISLDYARAETATLRVQVSAVQIDAQVKTINEKIAGLNITIQQQSATIDQLTGQVNRQRSMLQQAYKSRGMTNEEIVKGFTGLRTP